MSSLDDPEFVEALEKLFVTKGDIRMLAEYQHKLYESLNELHSSHRTVHEHLRTLADSHHRSEGKTESLDRAREELERIFRVFEQEHAHLKREIRTMTDEMNRMVLELRKIPQMEQKLERLEREQRELSRVEQLEERLNKEQEEHLRREERMNHDQEDRIRRLEHK